MAGDECLEWWAAAPCPADRVTPVTRPLGNGKGSGQHEAPNKETGKPHAGREGHLKALDYRRSEPDEGCFSSLVSDPWFAESSSCAAPPDDGLEDGDSPEHPGRAPTRHMTKRHLSRSDIRFAFRENEGGTPGIEIQNSDDRPMSFSDHWRIHNRRQQRIGDTRCTSRPCR